MSNTIAEAVRPRENRPGYRPYRVTVTGIRRLSPHFVRVTLGGDDLGLFGRAGLDQRIKLVIPTEGLGIADLGADDPATIDDGSWYARWRAQPDRNPLRTYTVRAVRPESREIDVDMVSHGEGGPASRWLARARPGDELVVVGPDDRSVDHRTGIDWHPGEARNYLLVGDETAAPAICSVLESLGPGCRAQAFVEVPDADDELAVRLPAGARLRWLPRGERPHGAVLEPAVRDWLSRSASVLAPAVLTLPQRIADVDVDRELLWESPEKPGPGDFYAWLAGEAAVIKRLRRLLVSETGIDRRQVAFMGYWRLGRAEAQ